MIEFFTSISSWHWYVLGILLLAAEAVGAGGFLLGMAAAALTTGLLTHSGLGWQWQMISFALLSVIFTALYWYRFKNFNQQTDRPDLNDRTSEQIGRQGLVVVDESSGLVKAKLGDTLWQMRSADTLKNGDLIKVLSTEGVAVVVEKVVVEKVAGAMVEDDVEKSAE